MGKGKGKGKSYEPEPYWGPPSKARWVTDLLAEQGDSEDVQIVLFQVMI